MKNNVFIPRVVLYLTTNNLSDKILWLRSLEESWINSFDIFNMISCIKIQCNYRMWSRNRGSRRALFLWRRVLGTKVFSKVFICWRKVWGVHVFFGSLVDHASLYIFPCKFEHGVLDSIDEDKLTMSILWLVYLMKASIRLSEGGRMTLPRV